MNHPAAFSAIFDLDGTLIDVVSSAARVKSKILREEYGIDLSEVPDPYHEQHKGSSIATLLAAIAQGFGVKIDQRLFTDAVVNGITEDLKQRGVTADPALVRFLRSLKDHGVELAIATTSTRQSADNKLVILGIRDFFRFVLTAEDITEHKPHPEVYIAAMKRLNVAPRETVIFEDALSGIQAGVASGARVIGVTRYNADKSPLPGTVMTIDSWDDITYDRIKELFAHPGNGNIDNYKII